LNEYKEEAERTKKRISIHNKEPRSTNPKKRRIRPEKPTWRENDWVQTLA